MHLAELYRGEAGAPSGVVIVAENSKFDRRGGSRQLQRVGLELVGQDDRGKSVWCKNFLLYLAPITSPYNFPL